MTMMMENIIDRYETTFGKVIVVSTRKQYQVGDQISTEEGLFRIKQVITPTRPTEKDICSFVID